MMKAWTIIGICLFVWSVVSADSVPCAASSYGVVANTGSVITNSGALVDSYQSSLGAYGGSNVGSNAIVQAATLITNNGGVIHGIQRQNAASGFGIVPIAPDARNLPLGSPVPGSLNINIEPDSITLAPGNYVAANININFPGAINISPAGEVRIWVTGNLNLGGNENLSGIPKNLAFLVTGTGTVNVNSNGSLFGLIYAPESHVNLESAVYGSVIGSSVTTLNSQGAVHFDSASVCPQTSAMRAPLDAADPLPAHPTELGCYVGTLDGWMQVQCIDPTNILPGHKRFQVGHDGVTSIHNGAAPVTPLVYGQVETVVESVASETNTNGGSSTANQWSVQNNTNFFACNGTDSCVVQFAVATDGGSGKSAVCLVNADGTTQIYNNTCVGVNGQSKTDRGILFDATTRIGPLQAFDFANVAGFSFTQNGQARLALVAQFSWVSNQDVAPVSATDLLNRIPGLYAVVAPDLNGLAGQWTDVTGGIIGMDNSSVADFTNAEVLTRVVGSSCPDDVSGSGPTCPGQPTLSSSNVQFKTTSPTLETDNLTIVETPTLTFPNQDLVVTDILGSTASGACLAGQTNHLFIKDNVGDNGGVPSNVGGVPFWESPDIFVVPSGTAKPGVNDVAPDLQLTAEQPYDVYLRVHNDSGCAPVTGPISVFIDAADPDMGFTNWQPVTAGAASGQYTTFGVPQATIVPVFGAAIIGPFTFKPGDGGHKCLLAAVAAGGEMLPPTSIQPHSSILPPAYSSNQIAQRNLQIGSSCTYNITNPNTTSANLLLGINVTPPTPPPGSDGGPAISLAFNDPTSAFFNAWQGQSGITVTKDNGTTNVALNTADIALNTVALGGGQSPAVNISITPSGAPPSVNISALLNDPMTGNILQANGGTCQGTEIVIPR
jgi:hypothetical protein